MRVLSRKFTKREKFLLSVLCLILVGFVYMQLIYTPIQNRIAAAESEKQTLEAELMAVNTKVERIESMERELESLVAQGKVSYMGSYNNSKAELKMLNDILRTTSDYSISFSNATRDGNQVRRNFSLQFTTPNYNAAKVVLKELTQGEFRCMLGNVHCSSKDNNVRSGQVTINVMATFYETMVGGTEDAGLPAATNTETTGE